MYTDKKIRQVADLSYFLPFHKYNSYFHSLNHFYFHFIPSLKENGCLNIPVNLNNH